MVLNPIHWPLVHTLGCKNSNLQYDHLDTSKILCATSEFGYPVGMSWSVLFPVESKLRHLDVYSQSGSAYLPSEDNSRHNNAFILWWGSLCAPKRIYRATCYTIEAHAPSNFAHLGWTRWAHAECLFGTHIRTSWLLLLCLNYSVIPLDTCDS